jgi:hypothetical protein
MRPVERRSRAAISHWPRADGAEGGLSWLRRPSRRPRTRPCRAERPSHESPFGPPSSRASLQPSEALPSASVPGSSHPARESPPATTSHLEQAVLRISLLPPAGTSQNRSCQVFVDLPVSRNGLLAVSIGPNVVPTTAPEKTPATFGQSLFQVPPLHWLKCTPIRVREFLPGSPPTKRLQRTPAAVPARLSSRYARTARSR